ncbi:MAG: bifunctional oligoribonuclease/PAP phosphatase NrnA [Candidatus Omnitrophota bacterium]
MNIKKIKDAIQKFDKFLISAHINPEGDSIGSQIALAMLLERLGKKAIIVNESPVPKALRFMKGAEWILKKMPEGFDFEAACILDCPDLSRIGNVSKYITGDKIVLNIDHHVSNIGFGKYNWVDPDLSSVGEMIYKLYDMFKVKIRYDEAVAMYVAIMTDTGSFKYSNTSPETHEVVGRLIEKGIKPYEIYTNIYESSTFEDTLLLSEALKTLKVSKDGKISWLWVTKKMLKKTKASLEGTEGIINFARSLKGVEVAIFFRETGTKDRVKVSFRSKGKVDVNKLAGFFKGGGHKTASGATVFGKMKEVEKKVVNEATKIASKSGNSNP